LRFPSHVSRTKENAAQNGTEGVLLMNIQKSLFSNEKLHMSWDITARKLNGRCSACFTWGKLRMLKPSASALKGWIHHFPVAPLT